MEAGPIAVRDRDWRPSAVRAGANAIPRWRKPASCNREWAKTVAGHRNCQLRMTIERRGTTERGPGILRSTSGGSDPWRASLVRPVARSGGGRGLGSLIIVLIVGTAKYTAPKTFLFLLRLARLAGILLGGRRLGRRGPSVPHSSIRRRRGRSRFGFYAKNSLKNVAMAALLAGLRRLGAIDKGGIVVVRACRGGDLVGAFVQRKLNHTLRRAEGLDVRVVWQLDGALHELGPDGQCDHGATQVDIAIVVIADPDDAEQI